MFKIFQAYTFYQASPKYNCCLWSVSINSSLYKIESGLSDYSGNSSAFNVIKLSLYTASDMIGFS